MSGAKARLRLKVSVYVLAATLWEAVVLTNCDEITRHVWCEGKVASGSECICASGDIVGSSADE